MVGTKQYQQMKGLNIEILIIVSYFPEEKYTDK